MVVTRMIEDGVADVMEWLIVNKSQFLMSLHLIPISHTPLIFDTMVDP